MENTWGTRQQTSDPPAGSARAELAYFTLGAVALTVAGVAALFEHVANAYVGRGVYAILAGLMVIGGTGWTVARSVARAEERVRDRFRGDIAELHARVAELTTQVESLTAALGQPRVAYLPGAQQRAVGHRYFGAAAVGATGDASSMRTGLDPETIAAARSVARRLVDAPTLPRLDSGDS